MAHNAKLNQGKAFSLFGLATAMGYVMGPLLGGFLSEPWQRFGLRGPLNIFISYPFLLPCLVSTCFNILVSGISLFWLDETNHKLSSPLPKEQRQQDMEDGHIRAPEESDRLISIPDATSGPSREDSESRHSNSSILYCFVGIV